MSRPKPTVLLTHNSTATGKVEQVLAAKAIYAVFYDGNPINLKKSDQNQWGLSTKYVKSSFSNSGHAFNLAERLNRTFNTDLFTVHALTEGMIVTENKGDAPA